MKFGEFLGIVIIVVLLIVAELIACAWYVDWIMSVK